MTKKVHPKRRAVRAVNKAAKRPAEKPGACIPCMLAAANQAIKPSPKAKATSRANARVTPAKSPAGQAVDPGACCFQKMTINCMTPAERTFVVTVDGEDTSTEAKRLEVVGGRDHAPRRVRASVGACRCNEKKDRWPLIELAGELDAERHAMLEFDARAAPLAADRWTRLLWPLTANPAIYRVSPTACSRGAGCIAEIAVYPDITWSGTLSFSCGSLTLYGKSPERHTTKERVEGQDWSFSGELSYEFDGRTTKVSASLSQDAKKIFGILSHAQDAVVGVSHLLEKLGITASGAVSVTLPTISASYTFAFEERDDGASVEPVYSLALKADPLIGLNVAVDLLEALLALASGTLIGAVLLRAKQAAEKGIAGIEVEVAVNLTAGAEITGDLTWKKTFGMSATTSGSIMASIPVSLVATVSVSAHYFFLSAGAGAEAGGISGVSASFSPHHGEKGLEMGGRLGWNGLTVYYAVYATAGVKTKDKAPRTDASGDPELRNDDKQSIEVWGSKWWPEDEAAKEVFTPE